MKIENKNRLTEYENELTEYINRLTENEIRLMEYENRLTEYKNRLPHIMSRFGHQQRDVIFMNKGGEDGRPLFRDRITIGRTYTVIS